MRQTGQHRIQSFAFVISIGVAVCLSCGFISNLGADESMRPAGKTRLDSRINPNEAPVQSLVRLPGLGGERAGAIVAYRENAHREGTNPAFENCEDLQKIRGIGPKTVQGISEWIAFD
ncbi:MAG: ComEA family DNA-binding protein [Planctomycetota bacterium]|jgi:competence protein ComEA